MNRSTIAAVATPLAPGGIGIVRLSGPRAVEIALSVFRRQREPDAGTPLTAEAVVSHRLYHGYVWDGPALIDEVLLAVMKCPRSYTGEDVAEIHAHGGPVVVETIRDLALKNGAVLAEPGEFTRRAFVNGRIDLTQAEAVADMIEAASADQVMAAAAQMSGRLRRDILPLKAFLDDLLTQLEAATEFEDQLGDVFDPDRARELLSGTVLPGLEDLAAQYQDRESIRSGVGVVIAGAPNAGKSTLLNRLLGTDRAIVSNIPGTTRDLVDGRVWMAGRPFVFTDTAGIGRGAGDAVEAMGMDRAYQALDRADMVLFVVDAAAGVSPEAVAVFERIASKPRVVAINKSDLPEAKRFELPVQWSEAAPVVRISALHGQGIEGLWRLLARLAGEMPAPKDARLFNPRHRVALASCRAAVAAAIDGIAHKVPADLVAMDVREAGRLLSEVTGETAGPDVLDAVFGRFCVGK